MMKMTLLVAVLIMGSAAEILIGDYIYLPILIDIMHLGVESQCIRPMLRGWTGFVLRDLAIRKALYLLQVAIWQAGRNSAPSGQEVLNSKWYTQLFFDMRREDKHLLCKYASIWKTGPSTSSQCDLLKDTCPGASAQASADASSTARRVPSPPPPPQRRSPPPPALVLGPAANRISSLPGLNGSLSSETFGGEAFVSCPPNLCRIPYQERSSLGFYAAA